MEELNAADVSPSSEERFAALIGIDWADREHAWVLQVEGSGKRERGTLSQTPEAIEQWATRLLERFPGQPIAIALEQSRGALLGALSKYQHFTLFPVHPSTSARYRSALFPSGAKDDPKDADLILDLLLRHRDHLRPWRPDTEQTRQLQELVEKRRQLVDEKTAQLNRLTALLKQYFPQVLQWFEELGAPVVYDFLKRWPNLAQLQLAESSIILEFFRAHNCRSEGLNQRRLVQIAEARSLTTDRAIVEPAILVVNTLLEVVVALRRGIATLDQAIEQLCAVHPDYQIFASFPGAGPALAPRLLAAFGSQRERYSHASQVQAFSGIAPVVERSGKSLWIHFRWMCPKFLRQTFHEYAGLSIQQSAWARAFYDKQRGKGKAHHAAVRSLAYKWIRILYRCWKDRTPYSEERYRNTLKERAAVAPATPTRETPAAIATVDPPVEFVFKKSGSFWKFSDAAS